jgi:hypothetical protein
MRLLLDTHLLIWAMGDPRRLGSSLRERLEDPAHTLLFSVASLWELVIKAGLGHEGFQVEPPLLRRGLLVGPGHGRGSAATHRRCPARPLSRASGGGGGGLPNQLLSTT